MAGRRSSPSGCAHFDVRAAARHRPRPDRHPAGPRGEARAVLRGGRHPSHGRGRSAGGRRRGRGAACALRTPPTGRSSCARPRHRPVRAGRRDRRPRSGRRARHPPGTARHPGQRARCVGGRRRVAGGRSPRVAGTSRSIMLPEGEAAKRLEVVETAGRELARLHVDGARCSSPSGAARSATPPGPGRESTCAASAPSRSRPPSSPRSTRRSGARPCRPARGQEPAGSVPPARGSDHRHRDAADAP